MPELKPKYRPVFPAGLLRRALALARSCSTSPVVSFRARLAVLLHENPDLTIPEATRRMGCHENTVWYWRREWATRGFRLEDRPRPGRPRAFFHVPRGKRAGSLLWVPHLL